MTIAREQAVARAVEAQAHRHDAPSVPAEAAEAAIARAEASLEHALTVGQRRAVEGVLTSGRGVELVVGVAGSGKTTALAACRDGFEAAGYEVVGTSTSGQAARTLGREAGIAESRTLASLNWRIAHDQLRLSPRTVAVLDEAAMTDDAALAAFLEAANANRTKVVMVGDHRQLSSVDPGGGFEALMRRHRDNVHLLGENVRQADPAERVALAKLRAGAVGVAVDWYAGNGRIAVRPDRDSAIDAVVSGWAADAAQGKHAAMYAWRRANVAELNRRGREAWERMGRLSGPELRVGSTSYRAGDRIVTLAPGGDGSIVTSECGTVLAVDVRRGELAATMDDGRVQRFAGEDLDAEHLAHGYAVTVHRAQGATVAYAHILEDGGGRELAYVKMSRARERCTVYVVADGLEQAVHDLRGRWAHSRRIGWAIDQGTPAPGAPERGRADPTVAASLRHARLVAEREALAAAIPTDPGFALHRVEGRVRTLESELKALDKADGWGALRDTPVGEAAIALSQAATERRVCLAQAENAGLRERRQLRQRAERALDRMGPLQERFDTLAGPERARIRAELPEAKKLLAELEGQQIASYRFQRAHPEAQDRLKVLDGQIAEAAYELGFDRQGLDGIAPTPPRQVPGIEREPPGLDRGIALEL